MELIRYDPRKHREAVIDLVSNFGYRALDPIDIEAFKKEIEAPEATQEAPEDSY